MSEPTPDKPTPPAQPAARPATRPKRAAAPVAKPSAPTLAKPGALHVPGGALPGAPSDALSELAAIAGSTITPSAVAPTPSASEFTQLRRSVPVVTEAAAARQAASNRGTLVPPCLTLGVTLPILGIAWFALDRHRVLRDNPLGVGLPILLFVGGAIFLGLVAAMLIQDVRRTRSASATESAERELP